MNGCTHRKGRVGENELVGGEEGTVIQTEDGRTNQERIVGSATVCTTRREYVVFVMRRGESEGR